MVSPKVSTEEAFFKGLRADGRQPSLLTLTFSQVTTWIFARSLMNAAILGFYYGTWGTLVLLVALLQIWNYPMHDPVMMDRGFLADRETTRKSFLHACWISFICILIFGCLGFLAEANTISGESMNATLARLLGDVPMLVFSACLIMSAMSTLAPSPAQPSSSQPIWASSK